MGKILSLWRRKRAEKGKEETSWGVEGAQWGQQGGFMGLQMIFWHVRLYIHVIYDFSVDGSGLVHAALADLKTTCPVPCMQVQESPKSVLSHVWRC